MGIRDWFKKGQQAAADNKDAVKEGIDKAGDIVDEKTDNKFTEHVDKGQEAAKDYVEDLPEE